MSENHWELLILLAESFRQLEAVAEDAPHMTVAVETGGAVGDEEGAMLQEATGIKDLNEKGAMRNTSTCRVVVWPIPLEASISRTERNS